MAYKNCRNLFRCSDPVPRLLGLGYDDTNRRGQLPRGSAFPRSLLGSHSRMAIAAPRNGKIPTIVEGHSQFPFQSVLALPLSCDILWRREWDLNPRGPWGPQADGSPTPGLGPLWIAVCPVPGSGIPARPFATEQRLFSFWERDVGIGSSFGTFSRPVWASFFLAGSS